MINKRPKKYYAAPDMLTLRKERAIANSYDGSLRAAERCLAVWLCTQAGMSLTQIAAAVGLTVTRVGRLYDGAWRYFNQYGHIAAPERNHHRWLAFHHRWTRFVYGPRCTGWVR